MTIFNNSKEANLHAVIDVGSNSVRLVIYRISGSSFVPIHNEKVLAGLGRNIDETQVLWPKGVELALNAIKRFKILIDALEIKSFDAIATAACRDALNGREFLNMIKAQTGLEIKLISGVEEGRLSALGVIAGAPFAHGMMGDLGGSSLELVTINTKDNISESFHLGPLAIGDKALARNFMNHIDDIRAKINFNLSQSKAIKNNKGDEFHAVGGAWRNIAKYYMELKNYPLKVLHNFEIENSELQELCDILINQSKRSLEKTKSISSRRSETIPYAAMLLSEIMKVSNCKKVIISSFGLREGLLAEKFPRNNESEGFANDIIAFANLNNDEIVFGKKMHEWIFSLFKQINFMPEFHRASDLIMACCLMANIGLGMHPDHRAELTYNLVIRAPIHSIRHYERVFMARSIARRYGEKFDNLDTYECSNLLNKNMAIIAELIGALLRLGCNLSSNSEKVLSKTNLKFVDGNLSLLLPKDFDGLISESVQKRILQASQAIIKMQHVTNSIL